MTDRYRSVLVTFKRSVREDDLIAWLDAFRLFHNVEDVRPIESDCIQESSAHIYAQSRLRRKLLELLDEFSFSKMKEDED